MRLDRLYKKNDLGNIIELDIYTNLNEVFTEVGLENGQKNTSSYTIYEGKNIGRSNETDPIEQAEKEAKAKWVKYHDYKGYHISRETAANETIKMSKHGGMKPMKALAYKQNSKGTVKSNAHRVIYPCFAQRKLNGLRCIATKYAETVRLWYSGGKEITTMKHIASDLYYLMKNNEIFDGELYKHGYPLEKIKSIVSNNSKDMGRVNIEYHMFDAIRIEDLAEKDLFRERFGKLAKRLKEAPYLLSYVKRVITPMMSCETEADGFYFTVVNEGYEGIIYRNTKLIYEQKRSYNMIKRKKFYDEEFEIVGSEDGKGSHEKILTNFICKTKEGKEFKASMEGPHEELAKMWLNRKSYVGKKLTVRYQEYSSYGIPTITKGLTIREEYE